MVDPVATGRILVVVGSVFGGMVVEDSIEVVSMSSWTLLLDIFHSYTG